MKPITRRHLLRAASTVGLGISGVGSVKAARRIKPQGHITLSFGTYGTRTLKLETVIQTLARIGYDGLEVMTAPNWDAAPTNMAPQRRRDIRKLLDAQGLTLTALMENLHPSKEDAAHLEGLERLKQVAALGRALAPETTPLIQTVLGSGKWDQVKDLFLRRLIDWHELAEKEDALIAIKPHRGGGMSRPEEAVWLINQLGNKSRIQMVYDYSHYAFRDMTLENTVASALPYIAHVAVKDTIQKGNATTFVLPGESGNMDYDQLLSLLFRGGYRGDVCCEVSSAVWRQPGYDPVVAAVTCYRNMSTAFARQKIPRPH
ncbi:MAG: sugar phosphate isomerase/epimerase family protein [Planctomycetota bacterium]|nr:sugar phosphate isomerase/epimerase family protein [Planctomycetota bacterium]